MREEILKMKKDLKKLVPMVRGLKTELKNKQRECTADWDDNYAVIDIKNEYRHKHIAYCLSKGRLYKEIENSVREGNEPSKFLVEKYLKEYGLSVEVIW